MKKIILLFIIPLLIGCNNENEKNKSNSTKRLTNKEIQAYKIPEYNTTLYLPINYYNTSLEEYKIMVDEMEISDKEKQRLLIPIQNIFSISSEMNLFIDSIRPENFLMLIPKSPHLPLNNTILNMYKSQYNASKLERNRFEILSEKTLEAKLFNTKKFDYIKLKVEQESLEGTRYLTNYIISTANNSIAITYVASENKDFQNFINLTQVKD